jgi:hypothetical protein
MYITKLNAEGFPEEPLDVVTKFRNACGAIVRDIVPITLQKWKDLDEDTRNRLWAKLSESFRVPKGTEDAVRKSMLSAMARRFRGWKVEMNRDFVKKNRVPPPKKMGKITQAQWEEFVRQKTEPKAKELSETNSQRAKKNKHPHRLGSTGYLPKAMEWNRIIEEAMANGTLDPLLKDIDERALRWILARAGLTNEGKLLNPELVGEVAEKVQEYAEKRKKGEFKPRRENDILTAALGTPEHTGRARGISSKISWREAFPEYAASYRKHEKAKRTLEEAIDERVQKAINEAMKRMKETGCVPSEQHPGPMSPPLVPSSVGSVQSLGSGTKFPVDFIVEDTPCRLHIPINRSGTKTKQAAIGVVKPGLLCCNDSPVPPFYAVVQVLEITDSGCEDWEIDYPVEGIMTLQQAVNKLVLWHRRDIKLGDEPISSPLSRHKSPTPTSTPMQQKDSSIPMVQESIAPASHKTSETVISPLKKAVEEGDVDRIVPQNVDADIRKEAKVDTNVAGPSTSKKIHQQIATDNVKKPAEVVTRYLERLKRVMTDQSKAESASCGVRTRSQLKDKLEVWEEDGMIHTRDSLRLKVDIPIYKKEDVPPKFVNGRPFLTTVQLSKLSAAEITMHEWYMVASNKHKLEGFSYVVPDDAFWSKDNVDAVRHLFFDDLWSLYHRKRMETNYLTLFCL